MCFYFISEFMQCSVESPWGSEEFKVTDSLAAGFNQVLNTLTARH